MKGKQYTDEFKKEAVAYVVHHRQDGGDITDRMLLP